MKIFTNYRIELGKTLTFWGEGDNKLGVTDVVYLWQDRFGGLGDEIIYGTAVITKILQNNYFEAERIA